MYSSYILGSLLLLFSYTRPTNGCKGCVSLDEYNFDKIVSRFDAVLVKFDVAYPYGEKHDVFTKLAEELAQNDKLILAEVGVKDYGDKENEQLALKFGVGKDDLPAVRLFVKGKAPVEFAKSAEWTVDNLRNVVKDNTDIYLGLPGCLEKFDKLAMEFVNTGYKQKKLEEAQAKAAELTDKEKETAAVYLKYMSKIVETGSEFVTQELGRLKKILKEGKVNERKKTELSTRLNILRSFSLPRNEL
ncbi:windbeutel [Tribolium castaneum]|uniref:Endoplasmic reticulum resident protein 29 n=1 Tax=Tribolium castaneum TaxID=7070 RepID=D6WUG2_TRICA|nr:PREDICTED: protein windbeutel [Tribolium castaneum]EFA09214.1 windbeutel [Tribolium castaneum]|eukprot:XP_970926.1 PREDICTED: protein windbeutel [Tribolium castaneum]